MALAHMQAVIKNVVQNSIFTLLAHLVSFKVINLASPSNLRGSHEIPILSSHASNSISHLGASVKY